MVNQVKMKKKKANSNYDLLDKPTTIVEDFFIIILTIPEFLFQKEIHPSDGH